MPSGWKYSKRRRFIREDVYEDMGYDSGDILMNGNLSREGINEKKFREEQDGETEEQEENDKDG